MKRNRSEYSVILEGIEPESDMSYVEEGDVISADMIVEPEDVELSELINFSKRVCIEKRYDEEDDKDIFDVNVTVDDPESAEELYNWILNTGIADDDTIEDVAPGIVSYMNGEEPETDEVEDEMDDDDEEEFEDDDIVEESVSKRFARHRRIFEDADVDECGGACGKSKEDISEEEENEEKPEEGEEKGEEEDEKSKDEEDDDEETEDVPMTAVIITVKKGDEDKCKSEMVESGINEDDIEILDADDDSDNVEIKIDVNSIHELKDYLKEKGIDLEEKIGGEIIDDDEEDGESEEGEDNGSEEGKGDDDDFDNIDFGDLFSDEEGGEDKESEK